MTELPPILANYEALRTALETERLMLHRLSNTPAEDVKVQRRMLKRVISQITDHRNRHRSFYGEHGYDWMVNPSNYQNPLEAMYQLWVVRVLAGAPRQGAARQHYGNVAVRIMPSATPSAECVSNGGFGYIIISTAYIGLIKSYVLLAYSLFRLGKDIQGPPSRVTVSSSNFGGREIERALRSRDSKVVAVINEFVQIVGDYTRYATPTLSTTRIFDFYSDPQSRFGQFAPVFTAVEAYLIFHELAHLLEHSFLSQERTLAEELDADNHAVSMMINHASTNRMGPKDVFLGPVAGIQLFKVTDLIRRTFDAIESALPGNESPLSQALEHEVELAKRLDSLEQSMRCFGILRPGDSIYVDLRSETHLATIACQGYLIGKLTNSDPFEHFARLLDTQ